VNPFKSPAVVNGRKAKAPPHGFGRHREDVHAYRNYFHKIRNGTFVEVGAGDGELQAPHAGRCSESRAWLPLNTCLTRATHYQHDACRAAGFNGSSSVLFEAFLGWKVRPVVTVTAWVQPLPIRWIFRRIC